MAKQPTAQTLDPVDVQAPSSKPPQYKLGDPTVHLNEDPGVRPKAEPPPSGKVPVTTPKNKWRPLTDGEKEMARKYFKRSINLDAVKLHNNPHNFVAGILKYATTIGSDMYFPEKEFQQDFSTLDVDYRAWLIHELTHV